MWEFSHSTEKACCTNRLHDWALPNKHAPGQSAHWSLSHSHAAVPEVPLWRCVNTSGENNPMAWNIFDRWWSYVNVITSVYPFPIFQVMNCHLATRDLCNRARIPQAGSGGGAQMFSRMSESRQMGAHYFFPCLRNMLGNISGTGTSWFVLPVMWRGASSAKEMSHYPWSWLFQLLTVLRRWAACWLGRTIARNITSSAVGVNVRGERVRRWGH